jgi:hypothetical protein
MLVDEPADVSVFPCITAGVQAQTREHDRACVSQENSSSAQPELPVAVDSDLSTKELFSLKIFTWAYAKALSAQQRRKHVAARTYQVKDDQAMKRRKYRTGKGESTDGGLEYMFPKLDPNGRRKEPKASPPHDRKIMISWFVKFGEPGAYRTKDARRSAARLPPPGSREMTVQNVEEDSLQKSYARKFEGCPPRFRRLLRQARREERKRLIAEEISIQQGVAARERVHHVCAFSVSQLQLQGKFS